MIHQHFFATAHNFSDPQLTKDGKPYGPTKFKELVRECYLVAKNCSIPYSDALRMSFTERRYMLEFLREEYNSIEQARQEQQEKLKELKKR